MIREQGRIIYHDDDWDAAAFGIFNNHLLFENFTVCTSSKVACLLRTCWQYYNGVVISTGYFIAEPLLVPARRFGLMCA